MHPLLPHGIAADTVRGQANKILASRQFSVSARMSRFLGFAVDETLAGHADRLKEIVIGTEVFDRGSSYDPRFDPIVRVEARRLRTKLRAYYEGPGKNDTIVIEFPKGSYAPVFRILTPGPAVVEPVTRGTIAVLPFSNLSHDADAGYFSDGITEEITHALTRMPGLRVVAWNTAQQLRDLQEDIGSIRKQLNVGHVLRGSVRKSDERLRITAQLIDTESGQYVWSQTYDRTVHDIFAIQQEIGASIAATLRLQIEKQSPARLSTRDLECYQLCLKGRFHARERTVESLRKSAACFERALAIDNNSTAAHAGLADTLTLCAEYGAATAGECIPKARAAARKALELDPYSAEAHASLGLILSLYDWRWEEGERMFLRALELNHNYAIAHCWYGTDNLSMTGRFDEARIQLEIALELDPRNAITRESLAFLHTLARRYDDAIAAYEQLAEFDPSFHKAYTSMGRAYLLKGCYAKAIEKLEAGRAIAGDASSILGALGEAHARAGNPAEGRRFLEELHGAAARRPVHATSFAVIHLGLGEHDEALRWLERGAERHELQIAALNVNPIYDELRSHPRFTALLKTLGFAPVLP